MRRNSKLESLYEHTYKPTTISNRNVNTAKGHLDKKIMEYNAKSSQVEKDIRGMFNLNDFKNATDHTSAENAYRRKKLGKLEQDIKKLTKEFENTKGLNKTTHNIHTPKHAPTLTDRYDRMKDGKTRMPENHGDVNSTSHNFADFKRLSANGKALYNKIRLMGNEGETFEPYSPDIKEANIKTGRELGRIMRLLLDMGYKLGQNMYVWLESLDPREAQAVSNYEGYKVSKGDYKKATHPHFRSIKNQYMTMYDGDEVKADRMMKLYRKHRRAISEE